MCLMRIFVKHARVRAQHIQNIEKCLILLPHMYYVTVRVSAVSTIYIKNTRQCMCITICIVKFQ